MNKKRVMTCLAAGVCVLAVSAVAAFGSVNGYGNYKTAVKSLALDVDNVSAAGTFALTYDGKTVMNGQVDIACDGANQSSHMIVTNGDEQSEQWDTTYNGTTTWFSSDEDHYYTAEAENVKTGHGLLNIDGDDELSRRIITFLEMGADTVMGDLKNNVVEVASANGDYTYQLDISNSQVPALVNAGLSVLAYAASDNVAHYCNVEFQDWSATAAWYYEQQTGQALSEDFMAHYHGEINDDRWYEDNAELEKFEELQWEMQDHYSEELDQKMTEVDSTSGVLSVAADGTTTFYPDSAAYEQAVGGASVDDIEDYIGQDLTLDNVHFTFSVNKAGQLTANHIEATFKTMDRNGSGHTMVLTADTTLFDYGTTVVQPLDVGDRMPWDAA